MTASHPSPGQIFLGSTPLGDIDFHRRPANFLCSFLFHAAFIALIWLLARSVSPATPAGVNARAWQAEPPIIFSGTGGGSGGSQDLLPASRGALPRARPDEQFVPPSAVLIKDNPALPMEPTVLMAADAVPPQTGPLGDPLSESPDRCRTVLARVVELGMTVAVGWAEAKVWDSVTGSRDSIRRDGMG